MTNINRLKKSKTYFKTALHNITTLGGIKHLTEKRGKRDIFWMVLMTINVILTVLFIMFITKRYNEDQVVTVINPNCKVNQVPFPAVSICNFNMISRRESKNILHFLKHHNHSQEEIDVFLRDLRHLKDYGIDSTKVGPHKETMEILKRHYFTIDSLMENLHQKCENLLVHCSFNRRVKKCTDLFRLTKTHEGYCCSFNYAGPDDDGNDGPIFSGDDNIEYHEDTSKDSILVGPMIATSESGRTSGLYVVFNVEPEDYTNWSAVPYFGAKVILSAPNDYPETTTEYEYVHSGDHVDMKLDPLIFQTEHNVRSLSPRKRNCWFHNEVVLKHSNRYSFENCHTECKIATFIDQCGCVPYKYPLEASDRVCKLEDLRCLNNMTTYISEDRRNCQPICYMECNDIRYLLASDIVPFLPPPKLNVTSNINVTQLSSLRIYYMKSLCKCFKLKLLIDLNYVIATFGGVLSLSFGGSIISVIELTYLFLSAILLIIWDNIYTIVLYIWRRFMLSKIFYYN